jgi:hypothetical protein
VQLLEGCGCGTGERAGDGGIGDYFGAEGDFEDVVLGFASLLVGVPVLCLAILAWRGLKLYLWLWGADDLLQYRVFLQRPQANSFRSSVSMMSQTAHFGRLNVSDSFPSAIIRAISASETDNFSLGHDGS